MINKECREISQIILLLFTKTQVEIVRRIHSTTMEIIIDVKAIIILTFQSVDNDIDIKGISADKARVIAKKQGRN